MKAVSYTHLIRLWVRGRKAPAYRKRWGERYGFYRHPLKPGGIMPVSYTHLDVYKRQIFTNDKVTPVWVAR